MRPRGRRTLCPRLYAELDTPASGALWAGPPFPYLRWPGPHREVAGRPRMRSPRRACKAVGMPDLARSFDDVAAAYDRGRPRYVDRASTRSRPRPAAARACSTSAPAPASSRGPLLEPGFDVVAVEPLDGMRAILAGRIGAERARWPAPPRRSRSPTRASTPSVCGDSYHWFDADRAADELARVVRPGGGVVVCTTYPRWAGSDDAPVGGSSSCVVHAALPKGDHPGLVTAGSRRPDGLERHPAFAELERRERAVRSPHRPRRDRRLLRLDHVRGGAARAPAHASFSAELDGHARAPRRRRRSTSPTAPRCGSLAAARRARPARSCGSGELTSTGSPVDRVREGQPRGVQELALEAQRPGRAVLGVAGDRVADRPQVRADLVRAAGLQAHAQQRRRAAAPARSRSASPPRAARRCRSTSACARAGRGRAARRSCRCARAGGPRRARGTRA